MVILVDKNDKPIGQVPKMEAHEKALLHRAFSVLIFNSRGELLLQKRADCKYHSPGLWTNTCCSHPAPDQDTLEAANQRLMMEMGLQADLTYIHKFIYHASFSNNLTEHEVDHLFVGRTDIVPQINHEEVSEYKYVSLEDLHKDMKENEQQYTAWFHIIFDTFLKEIATREIYEKI